MELDVFVLANIEFGLILVAILYLDSFVKEWKVVRKSLKYFLFMSNNNSLNWSSIGIYLMDFLLSVLEET